MDQAEHVRLAYLRMLDRCEPFGDGHGLRWTGATNNHGYGVLRVNGGYMLAHRLAFLARTGQSPPQVCHHCDRPACVAEECLFAGDAAINLADSIAKGRARRNPLRGAASPRALLRPGQVRLIRRRHAAGSSGATLARAFGVSEATISNVVKYRRYADVVG